MLDLELLKSAFQLGGVGILGVVLYFTSRASDKRLDTMLKDNAVERAAMHSDSAKERELWRQTINTLDRSISDNTHQVGKVDCLIPKRRK